MPPKHQEKDAIVAVVDVGPTVSQRFPEQKCFLEEALHCVSMIFQRKIFSESKDDVALILFGTENTANPLHEDGDYKNISIARGLERSDWDLLHYVNSSVKSTSVSADWIDALVVAMDHIKRQSETSNYTDSKILLFTDFGCPVSDDSLDTIIQGLKALSIQLIVIGPNILGNEPKDDVTTAADGSTVSNHQNDTNKKPKSKTQLEGETLIGNVISEVNGAILSFEDALPQLLFFQRKKVRPSPWNVLLSIGSNLHIPVSGYIKLKTATLNSWKLCYAKDDTKQIITERTFYKTDEDKTNVDREDVIPAYKYGSTLVPFSTEDRMNLSYQSGERGLKLLGFTSRQSIPRHLYCGDNAIFIYPRKDDEVSSVALSALIHALYDLDMVAVGRRVYNKNNSPVIGFLTPRIKADDECLIWIQLPYAEDIRQFTFPSLSDNESQKPLQSQLDAIDKLIDASDLTKAATNEDGEVCEAFKSKQTLNIGHQRVFQCLSHRATRGAEILPPLDKHLEDMLSPLPQIQEKCENIVKEIETLFPLEVRLLKRKSDKTGANIFEDNEASSSKKPKTDSSYIDDGMAGLARDDVTSVGTVTPVQDFKSLISKPNQDFSQTCKQLEAVIQQLVLESLRDQLYNKALECVKVLREEAKRKSPAVYNVWLSEFRDIIMERNRADFWDKLASAGLSLISSSENELSDVSESAALAFFESNETKADVVIEENEDDADDLLDEL